MSAWHLRRSGASVLAARLVLGGLFVWYGGHKIADPIAFLKALNAYDVLPTSPPWLLNTAAVGLPWVEVLCGAFLALGLWLRSTAILVLCMTSVFTVAVTGRALAERAATDVGLCSIRFDCGCGAGPVLFCFKLAENTVLIALALLIATNARARGGSRDSVDPRPASA